MVSGSWTGVYSVGSAPSNRTVTVSGSAPMLIIGVKTGDDGSLGLTLSPAATGSTGTFNNANYDWRGDYLIYPAGTSPANNTVSGVDDGSFNSLQAGYLRVS